MNSIKEFLQEYFPIYLDSYQSDQKLLTLWDWDYQDYLNFLEKITPFLRENPQLGLSVLCSHPHCFTNGSGLQKEKGKAISQLIDFDTNTQLPFPLFQIKRGGGLTFHYPGQMIYYPLFNMNHVKLSPPRIMLKMIQLAKTILEEEIKVDSLDYQKLLGLWYQNKTKIASVGMGLEYYVSIHGMAFNFYNDDKMFETLSRLHPCGLEGDTYASLDKIAELKDFSREKFSQLFHSKFLHWIETRN